MRGVSCPRWPRSLPPPLLGGFGRKSPVFVCSARLLPEKLTVYTTLVGLLNARNYNFGGEFVEAMIRQLKETLKNNLYDEAVYLVSGSIPSGQNDPE